MDIKDRFKMLTDELANSKRRLDFDGFLARIGRHDLSGKLTANTPWVYFSQEVYREKDLGLKGDGGLGVLAGDISKIAEDLAMPLTVVTPFYSGKSRQALFNYWESDGYETLIPGEHGFEKVGKVKLKSLAYSEIPIAVYVKRRGSVNIITLYEPNIGLLYYSESNSDHRLYQEVVSGFAGYQALISAGIEPAIIHMNEAATVFGAVARLDDICSHGVGFDDALSAVRDTAIYTNHTLLPAAEGVFDIKQFEQLVFTNLKNDAVIDWVKTKFGNDGKIRLSTLALEIAARRNGVSLLHSRLSSQNYRDRAGNSVEFSNVTNGVAGRWIDDGMLDLLTDKSAIDEYGLPTDDFASRLNNISIDELRDIKAAGRQKMNQILKYRQDQRGNPIHIPEDAILFDYKRRLVSYKRFDMIFKDLNRLADILSRNNAHLLFTGRPHIGDSNMIKELHDILVAIDSNPTLKERVHYIQNYDEEVAEALILGGNCAVNIPIVGQEACGTSWMKDIAACKILVSTTDGGVADVTPPVYLEVNGVTYEQEAESLYSRMQQACEIIKDDISYREQTIHQIQAYLPIISGSRMIRDYLNLGFDNN
ncbi:alpha-glucan family phosphorylase [Candidatus Saccharibacteria bacterium]|nr:alpha-glucan family phosphorylase [Candidatus Saccharibacteria bacterium]